jgi:hypothetical protein
VHIHALAALLTLLAGAPGAERKSTMPILSHAAEKTEKIVLGSQTAALLAGRISVRLPEGMRIEPRQPSIMGAPEAGEDESRAVLDANGSRFVLMARELYASRGPDLRKAVEAAVRNDWGDRAGQCRLEPLSPAAPLRAVGLVPPPIQEPREANLVYAAYLSTPDGLVQVLTFRVDARGVKDAERWARLAREISASAAAGSRVPALKGGERHFSAEPGKDLVLALPDGMTVAVQRGPDFLVHRIRRVGILGERAGSCGIYVGAHPGTQRSQMEDEGPKITQLEKRKGKVLGQGVEWDVWARGDLFAAEVVLPLPGTPGTFLHLFCFGATLQDVEGLRRMMEGLRAA